MIMRIPAIMRMPTMRTPTIRIGVVTKIDDRRIVVVAKATAQSDSESDERRDTRLARQFRFAPTFQVAGLSSHITVLLVFLHRPFDGSDDEPNAAKVNAAPAPTLVVIIYKT